MRENYFNAYCDGVEDIYKRGMDFDDTELAENLKYPAPKKPKSTTDTKNLLILADDNDCKSVKKNLDQLQRKGIWVCKDNYWKIV